MAEVVKVILRARVKSILSVELGEKLSVRLYPEAGEWKHNRSPRVWLRLYSKFGRKMEWVFYCPGNRAPKGSSAEEIGG